MFQIDFCVNKSSKEKNSLMKKNYGDIQVCLSTHRSQTSNPFTLQEQCHDKPQILRRHLLHL